MAKLLYVHMTDGSLNTIDLSNSSEDQVQRMIAAIGHENGVLTGRMLGGSLIIIPTKYIFYCEVK